MIEFFLILLLRQTKGEDHLTSYWPDNVAVVRGNSFTLRCGFFQFHVNNSVHWKFYPAGSKQEEERFVFYKGAVTRKFTHFNINHSEPGLQYDLTTDSTTLADAGTYRCIQYRLLPNSTDSYQAIISETQVIVMTKDPECNTNLTDNAIEEDNSLWIACNVDYRGNWVPSIEWWQHKPLENEPLLRKGINFMQTSNWGSSFILETVVNSSDHNSSFVANIFFSIKGLRHSSNNATNNPDFVYRWASGRVNVLQGVKNIKILPPNSVFKHGDRLLCTADGNPKPKYEWIQRNGIREENDVFMYGSELKVTKVMARDEPYTFQCTAYNEINGKRRYVSTRIVFNVKESGLSTVVWVSVGSAVLVLVLLLIITSACTYKFASKIQHKHKQEEPRHSDLPKEYLSTEFRNTYYEEIDETTFEDRSTNRSSAYTQQYVCEIVDHSEIEDREHSGNLPDRQHKDSSEVEKYELMTDRESTETSKYTAVMPDSAREKTYLEALYRESGNYIEVVD